MSPVHFVVCACGIAAAVAAFACGGGPAYTPADLVGGTTGRFTANGRAYTREDFAVGS